MDNVVLKKRLSTFRNEKGVFRNVSQEVLFEVLKGWESWPGTLKDFYSSIGVSSKQMAKLMGKAKKLKREGGFPAEEFKEVNLESVLGTQLTGGPCQGIELNWEQGKVIRFAQVEQLVDFLKKVA